MRPMKRPNLRIVEIEEGEIQLKNTENILNKITEENFPSLKKDAYEDTRSLQNTK